MYRPLCAVFGLHLVAVGALSAQQAILWRVRGDTSGAPPGCSAAAGISAINAWFAAFRDADSAGLGRATAPSYRGRFVFSTGRFTTADTFFVAHTLQELLPYARERARRHERMTVQEVTFNRWRGRGLEFGPIYLMRTADDLGDKALAGIGKGEYWCGQGLSVLNLGPRPDFDPGPRQ